MGTTDYVSAAALILAVLAAVFAFLVKWRNAGPDRGPNPGQFTIKAEYVTAAQCVEHHEQTSKHFDAIDATDRKQWETINETKELLGRIDERTRMILEHVKSHRDGTGQG